MMRPQPEPCLAAYHGVGMQRPACIGNDQRASWSSIQSRLHTSIQQAILDGLGNVGEGDGIGGFEVGDGAADAADFVVGARGEAELGHGLSEHGEGGLVEGCEFVEHLAAESRVGEAALSCALAFASAHGQVAHLLGGGAGGLAGEFAPVDGGRLDVDVDAVEEGA